MKPLFEVGEDVYLVSESLPEFNGPGTISGVFTKSKPPTCSPFYYAIGISLPHGSDGWCECCLRKRFPPESLATLTEILDRLPKGVTV